MLEWLERAQAHYDRLANPSRRRARDSAEVREMLAWVGRHQRSIDRIAARRAAAPVRPETFQPGTHALGERVWDIIAAARDCWHGTHHVHQADALMRQLAECMNLASTAPAVRPQAASPAAAPASNRTRGSLRAAAPMNPVQSHHSTATSRAPGSVRALDSAHWLNEYYRVEDHFDRCEVVRRAADYMAGLLRLDPDAVADRTVGESEDDLRERIAIEGYGHELAAVAERFPLRSVVQARLAKGQHPVRGVAWTPPEDDYFAAREARTMRDAGVQVVDIASALGRKQNTVGRWVAKSRRSAA
jgi:hypothetical protein